jgi:hypothetical protein
MKCDIELLTRYKLLYQCKTNKYSEDDIYNALYEHNKKETLKLYLVFEAYENSISKYYHKFYNGIAWDKNIDAYRMTSMFKLNRVIVSINKRLN